MPQAEVGVIQLVQELEDFIFHTNNLNKLDNKPWKVIIASGTGTMALFVARHFALNNATRKGCKILSGTTIPTTQKNEQILEKVSKITPSLLESPVDDPPMSYQAPPYIDISVIAIPCVGSSEDLHAQMKALDNVSGIHQIFPIILPHTRDYKNSSEIYIEDNKENINGSKNTVAMVTQNILENKSVEIDKSQNGNNRKSKRIFGNPCKEHYDIWSNLITETGVTFDLIYTPRAIEILFESFEYDKDLWKDSNLLYYHCGGLEGNESQLGRYKYSGLIDT